MPRSNPHARERVMDDRKHLGAFASFVPFAGRETSGVSSAGSSRGSALQTPTRASVTKRCSRLRRVGALLVREDPRLGALGPCRRDKSFARTVRSSSARLALSDSSALRKGLRRTRTGATATARRSPGWRKSSGPAWRFVATGHGPCALHGRPEQRGTDLSKRVVLTIVSQWQKSDERRRRRGRAQHRETEATCRSETQRWATVAARRIARPMEGALDHQYSHRSSRVDVGGWSWPRARRHVLFPAEQRAVSSGKRKPKEDRRSAVTGASEDEARSTSREETPASKSRNRALPKCVGRRETRHASARVALEDHRTSRGCPSSKCRWQKLVARISGR
jgi:hypothetical protein